MKRGAINEDDAKAATKRSRLDEKEEVLEDDISKPAAAASTEDVAAAAAESKDGTEDPRSEEEIAAAERLARILKEDEQLESGFLSFPEKLMSLLDGGEVEESMWWLPDGDAFCLDPHGFAEKILDVHFQGTKFESFTRKLNRWGFKRVAGQKVPLNTMAYFHHDFLRGQPDLLNDMSGSNAKSKTKRRVLEVAAKEEAPSQTSTQNHGVQAAMPVNPNQSTGGNAVEGGGIGDQQGHGLASLIALQQQQHPSDQLWSAELAILAQQQREASIMSRFGLQASADPSRMLAHNLGNVGQTGLYPPDFSNLLLSQGMMAAPGQQTLHPSAFNFQAALMSQQASLSVNRPASDPSGGLPGASRGTTSPHQGAAANLPQGFPSLSFAQQTQNDQERLQLYLMQQQQQQQERQQLSRSGSNSSKDSEERPG